MLVGGFNPSEKYESQIGSSSQLLGKINHVPNHQPVMVYWSMVGFAVRNPRKHGYKVGPPNDSVQLLYNSNFTLVSGTYNSILFMGFINHLTSLFFPTWLEWTQLEHLGISLMLDPKGGPTWQKNCRFPHLFLCLECSLGGKLIKTVVIFWNDFFLMSESIPIYCNILHGKINTMRKTWF